jgi:hypothetical protein
MLRDTLSAIETELLNVLSNSGCYEPAKYGFEEFEYLSPDLANHYASALLGVKGWYKASVHQFKPNSYFVKQVLADDFDFKSFEGLGIEKKDASLYQYIIWQGLKASFGVALISKSGKPDLLVAFDKSKQNDNVLYYYDNDQIFKPIDIKKMRQAGYVIVFDTSEISKKLKGMLKFRRDQLARVSVVVAKEILRPRSREKIILPKIA